MYVIYHIASTMQVGPTRYGHPHSVYAKSYKTEGRAKRACAMFNSHESTDVYAYATEEHYRNNVVHMVERTNLRSGKKYMEPSNTPDYCSPSCEAYWTM